MAIVFIWAASLSAGVQRSNILLLVHLLRLNIDLLPTLLVELIWICKIFKDIGFPLSKVQVLWCDNGSTISLALNLVFHACTKYVEIN